MNAWAMYVWLVVVAGAGVGGHVRAADAPGGAGCDVPFAASPSPPPSALRRADLPGPGAATMFDRRADGWVTVNAHLFEARFGADLSVEVQVNAEIAREEADLAQRFWTDRLSSEDLAKIRAAIPARIAHLDCLELSIEPPP